MNELAKNAWCFFLASLTFGIWVIPMLIGWWLIVQILHKWKPHWFKNV